MNDRTCLYAGTYDPWTLGHQDVLRAAIGLFDRVVIGVLTNLDKKPMFTAEERMNLIGRAIYDDLPTMQALAMKVDPAGTVVVEEYPDRLLVDVAHEVGAKWIVRGLRLTTEYEVELGACLVNSALAGDLQTIYIPSRQENLHVSSTAVRTQIKFRRLDRVGMFVPRAVLEDIEDILAQRSVSDAKVQ